MAEQGRDLIVRQHERWECSLAAFLWVSPSSAGAVTLSRSASVSADPSALGVSTGGATCVRAKVVDCSAGGLGLETAVFLPRLCNARACVIEDSGGAGLRAGATVRVQRVKMIGKEPRFYLGTSFVSGGAEGTDPEEVRRLIEFVRAHAGPRGEVRAVA